jgi:diguanylate cyclase (GGDEF)-like protein
MPLTLDNRTQIIVQVALSITLYLVMLVAWRTQRTYPGFGRWTSSKLPNALGWLLVSLRGLIPDFASVLVANIALFIAPVLIFEGVRQFRGKKTFDWLNYGLLGLLAVGFIYFTWLQPSVNARIMVITLCTLVVILRCAGELFVAAKGKLRPSYWFTAAMFGLYGLVLILRVLTASSLPTLSNPFEVDFWQSLLFMATNVLPVAWTFGFFMMTNARLTMELHKAESDMRELAMTDYLTGAYNRRSFDEFGRREFARAYRNGSPLALLIFDIDHFKSFNDAYGHLAGDELLCELVAACRKQLRQVDLLARWGGEEFAVLLPDTGREGCLSVAERLRQTVAKLTVPADPALPAVSGEPAHVTISVGGALWTNEDQNLVALLRRADLALYQAKRRGRDCVVIP